MHVVRAEISVLEFLHPRQDAFEDLLAAVGLRLSVGQLPVDIVSKGSRHRFLKHLAQPHTQLLLSLVCYIDVLIPCILGFSIFISNKFVADEIIQQG